MATKREPETFPELMERRAPAGEFIDWLTPPLSKLSGIDADMDEWMDLVVPVANRIGDLDWLTDKERIRVQRSILKFVQLAFTKHGFPARPYSLPLREHFNEFVACLESMPDPVVVQFCWNLRAYDVMQTPAPVWWLHGSGRLSGEISYENLSLAVTTVKEGNTMFRCWEESRWAVARWERDHQPYLELLSHSSYLVRPAAATVLGNLYFGISTKAPGNPIPPLPEILNMIQQHEIETPGVAGPFLQGAWWDATTEPLWDIDFDMKTWFLETLRKSARERDVPQMLTLEFYAHELFSLDADAIREFLGMGRKNLAVLTATQEPYRIPEMLPVLNEMASSDDPSVSAAIREYLSVRAPHAGMEYMREPGEELSWF